MPFEPPERNAVEENVLGGHGLLDPERPSRRWKRLRSALRWSKT